MPIQTYISKTVFVDVSADAPSAPVVVAAADDPTEIDYNTDDDEFYAALTETAGWDDRENAWMVYG